MTAAILSLLAALIPFVIWLWKRKAAKNEDPIQQHREKYEQIEKPVRNLGDDALARELDDLERLRTARGGERAVGDTGEGGPDVPRAG